MTGKTHVAIGMVAALTVASEQTLENQLRVVLASVVGSLLPDIDHSKAKLNQKLLFIKIDPIEPLLPLYSSNFRYFYFQSQNKVLGLLALFFFFIAVSSHRSFSHSIVGFLIVSSIVKLITDKYKLAAIYSGFVIGYVLHLMTDFFTAKGIELFYPLKIKVSSPLIINTKSSLDDIIFTLLSLYTVLLFHYISI